MAEPFNAVNPVRKTFYINESERDAGTPANDAGKLVQLESDGLLSFAWLNDIANKLGINVTENTYDASASAPETTLFSQSIPGGTLGTADGVRFTLYLSDFRFAFNDSCTFRLKYGSTTIASFVVDNDTSLTMKGVITGYILADGAAGAQKGLMEARFVNAGLEEAGDTEIGFDRYHGFFNGSATEDSTTNLDLIISADYAGQGTGQQMTAECFIVEKIQARLNA